MADTDRLLSLARECGAEFCKEALPTQGGTYRAWQAEYQSGNTDLTPDGWRPVPRTFHPLGVPGAGMCGGINDTIGLMSFAQANAIAWQHAAVVEAETGKRCEIRVVEYAVHYDIKCYRAIRSSGTSKGTAHV